MFLATVGQKRRICRTKHEMCRTRHVHTKIKNRVKSTFVPQMMKNWKLVRVKTMRQREQTMHVSHVI